VATSQSGPPARHVIGTHESAYDALKVQFSDEEQVKLTLMINIINGWNRLSLGFGTWMEPAAAKAAARAAA